MSRQTNISSDQKLNSEINTLKNYISHLQGRLGKLEDVQKKKNTVTQPATRSTEPPAPVQTQVITPVPVTTPVPAPTPVQTPTTTPAAKITELEEAIVALNDILNEIVTKITEIGETVSTLSEITEQNTNNITTHSKAIKALSSLINISEFTQKYPNKTILDVLSKKRGLKSKK